MQAISKLILGTVQFGLRYGVNNTSVKPNQSEVNDILAYAFDAGINCLDTAEAYGNAHEVIGVFHELNPSISFDIITKLPHLLNEPLSDKVDQYIEDLKVKKLKALLFHSFDTYIQDKGIVKELTNLKEQGKIELTGVSVYTNEQAEEVINDKEIDIIQMPFNLFDNHNKRGYLFRKAKEKGKIVHTRSVFLQGLFFCKTDDERKVVKLLREDLKLIKSLSQRGKVSLQQLALNYCLQQSCIDQTLIGIDNISQLMQNIQDARMEISDDLINKINGINIQNTDLLNPSLWKI